MPFYFHISMLPEKASVLISKKPILNPFFCQGAGSSFPLSLNPAEPSIPKHFITPRSSFIFSKMAGSSISIAA